MVTKEKRKIFGRYDLITFAQLFTVCALVFSVVFGSIGIMTGMQKGRASGVWDGDPAGSFAGGTGTAASPYLIANGAQLALMRMRINTNESGFNTTSIHYKLTADIHLNTTTGWTTWSATSGGANVWEPIGNNTNRFRANFDGSNHVIYGLYVNARNASFQPISVEFQGLFGRAEGARIRNVGIDQGFVKGGNFTGGIVGFADNASILDNVWNGCTVRSVAVGAQGAAGTAGPRWENGGAGGAGSTVSTGGIAGHAIVYNGHNKGEVFGGTGGNGGGGGGGGGNGGGGDAGNGANGGIGGGGGGGSGAGGRGQGGAGGAGGSSVTGGVIGRGSAYNSYNTGHVTGGTGGNGGGGGGGGTNRDNPPGQGGAGGAAGIPYTGGVVGALQVVTAINATTGALTVVDGDAVNVFSAGQITAGTPGRAGGGGSAGVSTNSLAGTPGGTGGNGGAGAVGTTIINGGIAGWATNNTVRMAHYQTGRGATTHAGTTTITTLESAAFNESGSLSPGVLGGFTTLVGALNRALIMTPTQMPTLPTTVPRYRRWAGTGINARFADFVTIEYNPGPFGVGNTVIDNKELTFDYTIRNATVANFTRLHYLQTKWQDSSGNIYEFNSTYALDTPLVLFPVWTLNQDNAAALRYELQNRINAANLVNDPNIYSHATISALQSAITYGQSLLPSSANLPNLRTAITNINTAIDNLETRVNTTIMYNPGPLGTGAPIVDTPEVGRVVLRGTTYTRTHYTQTKWQDSNGVEYDLNQNLGTTEPLVLYPVWQFNDSDPAALRFVLQGAIDIANQYNNPDMWSHATITILQNAITSGLDLLTPPSSDITALETAISDINTAVDNLAPKISAQVTYNPGPSGTGLPITENLEVGVGTLKGATYTRMYYDQIRWQTSSGVQYEFDQVITSTTPLTLFPVWHIDESNPEALAIILQELIDDALKLDKDDIYTQSTLDILRAAILAAQELIDEESRNLAELLAAIAGITDAVDGLESKPTGGGGGDDDGSGGGGTHST